MTYQEREEILSKEALHISDFQKLYGVKYSTAAKLLQDMKIRRQYKGLSLRLQMQGYIHTADYLEEIGFDPEKIQDRYLKKMEVEFYNNLAAADEAFLQQKKIYSYS